MKKITVEINGYINEEGAKKISSSLNNLSGVVAADVALAENRAFAYCGDKLQQHSLSNAVREAGYGCHIVKEEYITDVEDYKRHQGDVTAALSIAF